MLDIVDDAVSGDLAHAALADMRSLDFNFNENRRFYQDGQTFDSPVLPEARECYTASFYRSHPTPAMAEAAEKHIIPRARAYLKEGTYACEMWAQKMMVRDHYRTHHDGYLAPVSFVWYVNDNWRCDWGGLFVMVNEDGSLTALQPRFNRLIIMAGDCVPHFVTAIEPAALQPRFAVVGFLREQNVAS